MESISIANKILKLPARSYKILQDPTRFHGMLEKNAMESISISNKILQDPTRFYVILDKNAFESISIAKKIPQDSKGYLTNMYGIHINSKLDPTTSCKVLQDPTRS